MKIEIYSKGDLVQSYIIRSDHIGKNPRVDDSEFNVIGEMVMRYCSMPDQQNKIVITPDTLPNDPNTKDGRKKLMSDLD